MICYSLLSFVTLRHFGQGPSLHSAIMFHRAFLKLNDQVSGLWSKCCYFQVQMMESGLRNIDKRMVDSLAQMQHDLTQVDNVTANLTAIKTTAEATLAQKLEAMNQAKETLTAKREAFNEAKK